MLEGSQPTLNLDDLPLEVLVLLFSHLNVEQCFAFARENIKLRKAATDNQFWQKKFKQHFPHLLETLEWKYTINWYAEFLNARSHEYAGLHPTQEKLFSLTKDGDVDGLTKLQLIDGNSKNLRNIKLIDLDLCDCSDTSVLTWAQKQDYQLLLDYFYKLAVAEYSIDSSVDTSKKDAKGRTILHWAISCRQPVNKIKQLIELGANVDDSTNTDHTPLIYTALYSKEAETAELLIQRGARIDKPGNRNLPPLGYATIFNNVPIFKLLLEKRVATSMRFVEAEELGTDRGDTLLHLAVKCNHHEIVEALLNNGFDVNAKSHSGHTALMYAAEQEIMDLLIKHGASVNVESNSVFNALAWAIIKNNFVLFKLLLEKGADPLTLLSKNKELNIDSCDTALHLAVKLDRVEMVKELLEHILKNKDADKFASFVNSPSVSGYTPLAWAIIKNNFVLFKLLLEKGANPSIILFENKESEIHILGNALHLAVKLDRVKIVIELLEHIIKKHADKLASFVNDQSLSKCTPLAWAIIKNNFILFKLLLEKGADPSTRLSENEKLGIDSCDTALHLAVKLDRVEMVKELLEPIIKNKDADKFASFIDDKSHSGCTPLVLAVINCHNKIAEILLDNGADLSIAPSKNFTINGLTIVEGDTLLHLAAKSGNAYITQLLISKKANLEAVNANKEKPADVAKKGSKSDMQLKLPSYLKEVRKRERTDYKKKFLFWNWGYSAGEKKDAAEALQKVLFDEADKSLLEPHQGALKNGELGSIYASFNFK